MGKRGNRGIEANDQSSDGHGENREENNEATGNGVNRGDIVLKVYLHCEECAKKVINCLKHYDGVEDAKPDLKDHKVTVKGKNMDPTKVAERVRKKCNKQVDILFPKLKNKNAAATAESKPKETKVTHVQLSLYIHCENCGNDIKERIQKMQGVETVEVDLKNSKIAVKGKIEPQKLVEYIDKKMGKQATIVKAEHQNQNQKDRSNNENSSWGRRSNAQETFYPPPDYAAYLHASQVFSDENAEACLIM